jgi:hypothetical protein
MKKEISEMVWPVENYTDKIHTGVKATMANYSHLSFTLHQLRPYLERGYTWLKNPTEKQSVLLDKIIKTSLAKLIQLGLVKKITSSVQVEPQWQWASKVAESGYKDVTSQDDVAQTEEAKKAVGRRAIGGRSLWKLNNKPKLGLLH